MSLLTKERLLSIRPFIFFSIIMILKSFLAWNAIFEGATPWIAIFKEIPFVLTLFCLIEWFATKRKMGIYLTVNLLITAILFAAIMYYKYYGVIVTYHALQQVNQVTAVKNSVFSLLQPYYLLIFLDIIVIWAWWFFNRRKPNRQQLNLRKIQPKFVAGIFALSIFLCLFNIVPNRASMNEIKKAQQMGILNYETYAIFANEEEELVDSKKITQEYIHSLKNNQPSENTQYQNIAQGRNVIIIQLESFQNFLVNLKIDGQEITPELNSLVRDNYYFNNFYQQVGQGNTSDAEFVVNTSFYVPPNEAATQNYAYKQLPSLPKLLKDAGYNTATFHTNVVEFWNRKELYQALGFDKYYDQEFFTQEDTVYFGPSDEVLYRKTAEKLDEMQNQDQPFYAQVISMTAHHPFTLPHEKDLISVPDRYQDTMVGDYLRSQNYADHQLGVFIEDLKERGIWDNSLIVLYGDHLGLPKYSLDRKGLELMEEIYDHPYGYLDMINIPLVIAAPGITTGEVFENVGGQVDILPTIANLTGISLDNHIHFGQDLLNSQYNLLPQRYYLPSGSFVNDKALFIPGVWYEDGEQFPLDVDLDATELTNEIEYNRALELLNLSDSYVDQLPDREQ